jgi:hypothetical protein
VHNYLHYTDFSTEEHTNEDTQPKAKSPAAQGWAALVTNVPDWSI